MAPIGGVRAGYLSAGKGAIPDSVEWQFNAQELSASEVGTTISTLPNPTGRPDADGGDAVLTDTGINGYQSLDCSSMTSEYSVSDANWTDVPQPYTVIGVIAFNQSSFGSVFEGGDPRVQFADSSVGTPGWRYWAGGNFTGGTQDASIRLVSAVFDDNNGNSELRENGVTTATGSPGTGSATDLSLMTFANSPSSGDLYGMLELHDGLPSNGLSTREQEIANMWDITLA